MHDCTKSVEEMEPSWSLLEASEMVSVERGLVAMC